MIDRISWCLISEYSCPKESWFRRCGNHDSGHGNHLWLAWLLLIRIGPMSSPEPLCEALAGFTLVKFLVFYILANRFPNHRTARSSKPEYSTRPRRFGKTLNMSMLRHFLEIGTDKILFDGLYISENKDGIWKYGSVRHS